MPQTPTNKTAATTKVTKVTKTATMTTSNTSKELLASHIITVKQEDRVTTLRKTPRLSVTSL